MERVISKNPVLYHIQSKNFSPDGDSYDVYVCRRGGFTDDDLAEVAKNEFADKKLREAFIKSAEVNEVFVQDFDEIKKNNWEKEHLWRH